MDACLNIDFSPSSPSIFTEISTNEVIHNHSYLVDRLARQVFYEISSAIAIEDLVQIGNIALIESARKFVDYGTAQFSTYASIRVRGAMIDELRKCATISKNALRQRREFTRARQYLNTSLGRSPSDVEMAEHVDMAIGAYRATLNSMRTIEYTSIDDAYSDMNAWFADRAPGADEILEINRRRDAIASAVAALPEREQTILQLFFVEECSLEEIGIIFSVTAARICQIKGAALARLRSRLSQWHQDLLISSAEPTNVAQQISIER